MIPPLAAIRERRQAYAEKPDTIRQILTEGGPYLLSQIIDAGLLDELCLTLSPLLAGPGAGRIVADIGPLHQPGGAGARPLRLAHVLADDGHLLCRYVRPAG